MAKINKFLNLILYSDSGSEICRFAVCNKPDMTEINQDEFTINNTLIILKTAIHEYLSTKSGYQFIKDNKWNFNWADAILKIPNSIWRKYHLHLFVPRPQDITISVKLDENLVQTKECESNYIAAESYYGIFSQRDFCNKTCPVCGGKITYAFGTARCEDGDWMATDDELPELLGLDENFNWAFHIGQKVLLVNDDEGLRINDDNANAKYFNVISRFIEPATMKQYYDLMRVFDSEIFINVSKNDIAPL